jgi:CheY-like chemotaxis protein
MKKIILPEAIHRLIRKDRSFLNRRSFRVLASGSNNETLVLHRSEQADLIVTDPATPGLSAEILCEHIRDDEALRRVSIIVVCPRNQADAERWTRCGANALVPSPLNTATFLEEAHRLLHVAIRTDYRAPVAVRLEGEIAHRQFMGFTENVSASGMLFGSETELGEGDMVTCSFHLPDLTSIRARAEIVRVLERHSEHDINLYGVSFSEPSDPSVAAIEAFIQAERHKDSPPGRQMT